MVKCLFALGEINADEAVDELSALNLMSTPKILSKTNQLMITDTAAKLRNIRTVLAAFTPDSMKNGTVVKTFALDHVNAEDVLLVARPHLGLATGEMIGIDVSLSADVAGKHIFVTGIADKVNVIERLVESIDRPEPSVVGVAGEMKLQSHLVEGGNVMTVYNVLQTMLSGQTVRLSMDQGASTIVALATDDIQTQIAETVKKVQASDATFEVIPLGDVDPYFAITLLQQMLDLPTAMDDPAEATSSAPKIDADPGNRRLFVRGKRHQIDQIKSIVEGLASSSTPGLHGSDGGNDEGIRVLPITGARAESILETAATFWRSVNPVVVFPTSGDGSRNLKERIPSESNSAAEEPTTEGPPEMEAQPSKTLANRMAANHVGRAGNLDSDSSSPSHQHRLTTVSSSQSTIRCQVTPRGILFQSDDSDALDRFETHLKKIAGAADPVPDEPVVFYLQHCRPDDALRMLGELLEGSQTVRVGDAGTLVNGYVSGGPSGSYLSLISSQEGTTTMMAGSITVIADSRLNRLIVQGTDEDVETVAGYLRIIDKDESITAIETYGRSKVIELFNTKAANVADAIRDAFVGRVAESKTGNEKQGRSSLRSGGGDDSRESSASGRGSSDEGRSSRSERREPEPARNLEPKMTVAVHEQTNSLIVTAPEALLAEVESLVERIDSRGEQSVEVITPMNSEIYGLLLQQLTAEDASSGAVRSSARGSSSTSSGSSNSTSDRGSNSSRSSSRSR